MSGDQQLRDKLNEHQFNFDEQAWQQFEQMRDNDNREQPTIFWLYGLIGVLIVSLIGLVLYNQSHFNKLETKIKQQELLIADQINQSQKQNNVSSSELSDPQEKMIQPVFEEKEKEFDKPAVVEKESGQKNSLVKSKSATRSSAAPDVKPSEQAIAITNTTHKKSIDNIKNINAPIDLMVSNNDLESSVVIKGQSKGDLITMDEPIAIIPVSIIENDLPTRSELNIPEGPILAMDVPQLKILNKKEHPWFVSAQVAHVFNHVPNMDANELNVQLGRRINSRIGLSVLYRRTKGGTSKLLAVFDSSPEDFQDATISMSSGNSSPVFEILDTDGQGNIRSIDNVFKATDIGLVFSYSLIESRKWRINTGAELVWRKYQRQLSNAELNERVDCSLSNFSSAGCSEEDLSSYEGSSLGFGPTFNISYKLSERLVFSNNYSASLYTNKHRRLSIGIGASYRF